MTRKMTFKTLFAAVFLLAGTSGSWAAAGDVTTNVDIDFSNAITDGVVTGTKGSMTIGTNSSYPTSINSDGHLQLGKADNVVDIDAAEYAGTKDVVTVSFDIAFGNLTKGYTSFYLYDKDNAEIAGLSACTYDSKLTSSIGLTSSTQIQYAGKKATPAEWIGRMHFVISLDYATKTITTEATKYTNGSAGTASTYTATMTNTNSIASFKIGTNYTTRWSLFDNLKIETTAGNYDVESASYTVKYVCGDAEVKTSSIRTADVGTTPELTASDMSNIFDVDGVKYMYVSNDAAEKTVASDGTTVVTVTLRRAETWNYTGPVDILRG